MQKVEFKFFNEREKSDWVIRFDDYVTNRLPLMGMISNAWTEADSRCFEEGAKLIAAFSYCVEFVEQALLFKDYSRRADRLKYYVARIQKEVSVMMDGQELKSASADKQPSRRGRPKKNADATNGVAYQPIGQAISLEGVRWHLDQLGFLLSTGLKADVSLIASLRSTSAIEAEIAKDLAYQGKPQSVISPHSEAAIDALRSYKLIYEKVDLELANLYAGYLVSEEMKNRLVTLCSCANVSLNYVLGQIKRHWEKVGKPDFIADKPKAVTSEEEKERQKRYHNIRSYILRKDGKITASRIEKMKKYIAEAKQLGFDTSAFEIVLTNAEEKLRNVRETMLFA